MEIAQLNVRMDARTKREGDAVLARLGVSATEVIRALWGYLAEAQALPSFMRGREETPVQVTPASGAAGEGAGLALALAREQGLACDAATPSYDELRELAFEELVAEGVYRV